MRGLIAVDKVANRIRFYDPLTLQEMKAIDGPEPTVHELAIVPDGRTAFVPLYGDGIYGSNKHPNNKIVVVDLERQAIASIVDLGGFKAPHGMAAMEDGALWVVCDVSNALLRVDPARGIVEELYDCPGKGAHLLAASPSGSQLYISSKESALVTFDIAQRAFTASVPLGNPAVAAGDGSGSEGLALTPDGARLVAIDNARTEIRVIDTASDSESDRVALLEHPPTNAKRSRSAKPLFSPDGRRLVVTSYATGLAWVIDAGDLRRQSVVPVAKGPMGIAFMPDHTTVIVSSHDSGLLTRIDLGTCRPVGVSDGGGGIEVLAFY